MKPNAVHLVLVKVNPPLRVGDRFPLVLIFEKAGPIRIDFDVLGAGS
jgi:copper(I)-binding protein